MTNLPETKYAIEPSLKVGKGFRSMLPMLTQSTHLAITAIIACVIFTGRGVNAQVFQNINLEFLRRNVIFLQVPCGELGRLAPSCTRSDQLVPWGTGFLVSVPHRGGGDYVFIVTARHVVDPSWTGCDVAVPKHLHGFFNKSVYTPGHDSEGRIDEVLSSGSTEWTYPDDDSADVAVLLLNGPLLQKAGTENLAVSLRDFPTDDETNNVKTGDQIISAGLLVGASGAERNYPVFKFGYVSSQPGEKIGLPCCPACSQQKLLSQWLIAANLVPGNSGSPVYFVPSAVMLSGEPTNRRALLLGIESTTFPGTDIAGMTPVKFLVQAIRKINLTDADFTITGQPFHPTSSLH